MFGITSLKGMGGKRELTYVTLKCVLTAQCKIKDKKNCTYKYRMPAENVVCHGV